MRAECCALALLLSGCLGGAGGRARLEAARAGLPRALHEVGELGDPRVPAGRAASPRIDEALDALRPWAAKGGLATRLAAVEGLRRLAERTPGLVRGRYQDLFDRPLEDPAPEVRWRAAWAIGRLGLARPGLLRALNDPSPRVAERAAWATGRAGDPGAVPALIEALGGEPLVAVSAEAALNALTGQRLGRDPAAWRAWVNATPGSPRPPR